MDKNRILQLDGLRGIAVLLVVAFHFINNSYQSAAGSTTLNWFERVLVKVTYFGWCGVDLFFLLSGFLIGTILLRNRESPSFFKTFYIRRAFRIIPIYFLLLLIFLGLKTLPIYNPEAYIFQKNLPIWSYFIFIQNYFMSGAGHFGPQALTPTWSLAVEEQFYLIIPVIIYVFRPKYLIYFIMVCLILAPICRYFANNWYERYTALYCRIDTPMMGILLAYFWAHKTFRMWVSRNSDRLRIILIALILGSALLYIVVDLGVLNHTLLAIIFALILVIILCSSDGFFYRLLTSRFLVFFGGISYFLYLYHQLVNGLVHLVVPGGSGLKPAMLNTTSIILSAAAFAFVLIAAVVSKHFLESPLIRFSHRFSY